MNVDTNLHQIRTLMDRRANIRNMSVIAHGKFLTKDDMIR